MSAARTYGVRMESRNGPISATLRRIAGVVGQVQLRHPAIEFVAPTVSEQADGSITITTERLIPDRGTGKEKRIYQACTLSSCGVLALDERMLRRVYIDLLEDSWMHEFEEALHVNGKRVRDPHLTIGECYGHRTITAVEFDDEGAAAKLTLEDGSEVTL